MYGDPEEREKKVKKLKDLENELRDVSREFADSGIPEQQIEEWYDIDGGAQRDDTIAFGMGEDEKRLTEIIGPHEYGHSVFKRTPLGRIWSRYWEKLKEIEAIDYKLDKLLDKIQDNAIKGSKDPGKEKLLGNAEEVIDYAYEILQNDWKMTPERRNMRKQLENSLREARALSKQLENYRDVENDTYFLWKVNEGVAYLFNLYYLLKKNNLNYHSLMDIVRSAAPDVRERNVHYDGMRMVTYGLKDVEELFERAKRNTESEGKIELSELQRKKMMRIVGDRIREITYVDNMDELKDMMYLEGPHYSARVVRGADRSRYPTDYEESTELGMAYLFGEDEKLEKTLGIYDNRKKKNALELAAIMIAIIGAFYVFKHFITFPLTATTSLFVLSPSNMAVSTVYTIIALVVFSFLWLEHSRKRF